MITLMPDLSEIFANPIFTVLAILVGLIFLILYLREMYIRGQLLKKTNQVLDETKDKSYAIIHDAIQKSQEIIGEAELEGIKASSETKVQTEKLEQQYVNQLQKATDAAQEAISTSKENFNKFLEKLRENINQSKAVKQSETALTQTAADVQESLTKTQAGFAQFLEDLKTTINQSQNTSQELIKQQVNQQFERFEQNLTDFFAHTEQQSTKAIELEVKSARQLIETYKSQQLALIDENIIAMLERTLSLVLSKKLSLKDQMDLVYESLEKAKAEKFIA